MSTDGVLTQELHALRQAADACRAAAAKAKGSASSSPEREAARAATAARDAAIIEAAEAGVPPAVVADAGGLSEARVLQIVGRARAMADRESEVIELVRSCGRRMVPLAPLARRVGMPIAWVQEVLERAARER